MNNAAIVSIGNELLSGQTVDTNSAYLTGRLMSIGVPTVCGYCVGDDLNLIVEALEHACRHADLVLVTGGLGPTEDDLTRDALARFTHCELVFSEELLAEIQRFFEIRGAKMAHTNRRQAYIPRGGSALPNPMGTAPGIRIAKGDSLIVSMPGVPGEMKNMFENCVLPDLKGEGPVVVAKKLKCFGAGESSVADKLGDLMRRDRNPLVNCTVHGSVITLHIIATARDKDEADQMIAADNRHLRELLGNLVFGEQDDTLPAVVGQKLSTAGKTIAVAESCTGGLIGKLLTDVPGASAYFTHGWLTYSNLAKSAQLGVDRQLIQQYGAVSEQVSKAMAAGAREKARSDISVAVTGIAGPGGGSSEKPVGLVYITVETPRESITRKRIFHGSRADIRLRTALTALDMVRLLPAD